MGNIGVLETLYDIFCVHMCMEIMHTYFLGIYAFHNFIHVGNMKCMFGNSEVA
jgi:hypothetical protein